MKSRSTAVTAMCFLLFIVVILLTCLEWRCADAVSTVDDQDCPVCLRVVSAAQDFALKQYGTSSTSNAFDRYCALGEHILQDEEQKFCYDTTSIRKELHRLMDLGADARRICRRVRSVNSDFCSSKNSPKSKASSAGMIEANGPVSGISTGGARNKNAGIHMNERNKRGIIYI